MREANSLESFFAEFNVRFSSILRFPPTKKVAASNALKFTLSEYPGLQLKIIKNETEGTYTLNRLIELNDENLNSSVVKFDTIDDYEFVSYLEKYTGEGESATCNKLPRFTWIVHDNNDAHLVHGLMIDVCHSICDGRYLCSFIKSLIQSIESSNSSIKSITNVPIPFDWAKAVKKSFLDLNNKSNGKFKLLSYRKYDSETILQDMNSLRSIQMSEIAGGINTNPNKCSRHALENDEFLKIITSCKSKGITITACLTGVILFGLAEAYFNKNPNDGDKLFTVDVLVDLRPAIKVAASPYEDHDIFQAIGTVRVGYFLSKDSVISLSNMSYFFLFLIKVTTQLKERVARGEALSQSLSVLFPDEGFSAFPGDATLELSNFGIVHLGQQKKFGDKRVHFSERFDEYEGVSILCHTEQTHIYSAKHFQFKISAAVGTKCSDLQVNAIVTRIIELLKLCGVHPVTS